MVQFSQDARPYTLELACIMLSLWGLVALGCDADAAAGPWRTGRGPWLALLLGLLAPLFQPRIQLLQMPPQAFQAEIIVIQQLHHALAP